MDRLSEIAWELGEIDEQRAGLAIREKELKKEIKQIKDQKIDEARKGE